MRRSCSNVRSGTYRCTVAEQAASVEKWKVTLAGGRHGRTSSRTTIVSASASRFVSVAHSSVAKHSSNSVPRRESPRGTRVYPGLLIRQQRNVLPTHLAGAALALDPLNGARGSLERADSVPKSFTRSALTRGSSRSHRRRFSPRRPFVTNAGPAIGSDRCRCAESRPRALPPSQDSRLLPPALLHRHHDSSVPRCLVRRNLPQRCRDPLSHRLLCAHVTGNTVHVVAVSQRHAQR